MLIPLIKGQVSKFCHIHRILFCLVEVKKKGTSGALGVSCSVEEGDVSGLRCWRIANNLRSF